MHLIVSSIIVLVRGGGNEFGLLATHRFSFIPV